MFRGSTVQHLKSSLLRTFEMRWRRIRSPFRARPCVTCPTSYPDRQLDLPSTWGTLVICCINDLFPFAATQITRRQSLADAIAPQVCPAYLQRYFTAAHDIPTRVTFNAIITICSAVIPMAPISRVDLRKNHKSASHERGPNLNAGSCKS